MKELLSWYKNMIESVDDGGNTALHVAAYRGQLPVFKLLMSALPSLASLTNNYGDTLLHMAIAGFRTPSFRRLDPQIQLLQHLLAPNIINVQNNDGRTPLHTALIHNIPSRVVDMLLSVPCIDLNVVDCEGNTPLDLLYLLPRTPSSEILIKRVVSAGGLSSFPDQTPRNSVLRMHGMGGSPGTSFRIPDAAGIEDICRSIRFTKSTTMSRLKILLRKTKENPDLEDDYSCRLFSSTKNRPIPLREQYSGQPFPASNKRILSLQGNVGSPSPSPLSKKKIWSPNSNPGSPLSGFSESSWSSPVSIKNRAGPSQSPCIEKMKMKMKMKRRASFNLRLMNTYLCFGGQSLAVENAL